MELLTENLGVVLELSLLPRGRHQCPLTPNIACLWQCVILLSWNKYTCVELCLIFIWVFSCLGLKTTTSNFAYEWSKGKKNQEVVTSNLLQYVFDIQDINILHNTVQLHVYFHSWIYNVCVGLVIFLSVRLWFLGAAPSVLRLCSGLNHSFQT